MHSQKSLVVHIHKDLQDQHLMINAIRNPGEDHTNLTFYGKSKTLTHNAEYA